MVTMIQCIADRGLIHSSIDVLCKKVGISKTFFYSFFSSKEELVLYALRYQQPRLLDYARQLMEDPTTQLACGRGDLPEKLLLRSQKRSRCFVH